MSAPNSPSKRASNAAPRLENTVFTPFSTLPPSDVPTAIPSSYNKNQTTTLSQIESESANPNTSSTTTVARRQSQSQPGKISGTKTSGQAALEALNNNAMAATLTQAGQTTEGSLLDQMSITTSATSTADLLFPDLPDGTHPDGTPSLALPPTLNLSNLSTSMFSEAPSTGASQTSPTRARQSSNSPSKGSSPSKSRTLPPRPVVETCEVSLSARSFNERMLVDMRDVSIGNSQEQVRMITKQNESLRRSLNEVESEMITLQEALSSKDSSIVMKDRELEEIQRECVSLMAENAKNDGRENAMDLASKQNTHLLRLLEQEEAKRAVIEDDRDGFKGQYEVVRDAHEKQTMEAAEVEGKLKENMRKVRQRAHDQQAAAEKSQTMAMELQASLSETQRVAKFEISNMKDELMARRDKVYELLEKLQTTEDKLRISIDENERKDELLESSNERSNELDRRLNSVRTELAEREQQLLEREEAFKLEEVEQRNREASVKRENQELEKQMGELSTTVMQLVERHKTHQETKRMDDERYDELKSEHELLREQQQRLLESLSVKSKQFMQLEADHADAQGEIKKLQDGIDEEFSMENIDSIGSIAQTSQVTAQDPPNTKNPKMKKEKLWNLEATARRRMLSNFLVSVSHATIVSAAISNRCIVEACQTLVLDECNVDDVDIITLVSVLKSSKSVTEVNLVSNRISDAGAAALAGYIGLGNCKLSFLDLRNNGISMNGIKKLAEAVQNNVGRGIEHVYVHNDGRIDAIGVKIGMGGEEKKDGDGEGRDATTLAKIKNAMSSIIVVDVRENFPEMLKNLPQPVGTENTVWSKIYESMPSEESLKIAAQKKRALKMRKENSEYRDIVVGGIYGAAGGGGGEGE